MGGKAFIYITDFITDDPAVEKRILGDIAEVRALGAECEAHLEGKIEDANCIIMYHFLKAKEVHSHEQFHSFLDNSS
jgi:hypothetical protein